MCLKKVEWAGVKLRRYMRYSQSEKIQIIRLVEESPGSIKRTLLELNINRSTFYKWYRRYQEGGFDALANRNRHPDNSGMRYHHGKANGWLKHLLSTRRSHLGSWSDNCVSECPPKRLREQSKRLSGLPAFAIPKRCIALACCLIMVPAIFPRR